MDKDNFERKLSQTASLTLAIVVLLGTILRPLFNEQNILFSVIGVVNFVIAFSCYWLIKRKVLIDSAAPLVIVITLCCLIPLLYISGGVDSQFAFLIPIIPVFSCLFANFRAVILTSIFLVLMVLVMFFNASWIIDIDQQLLNKDKHIAKTFWLIISILSSASFGYYYRLQSQKIRDLLHKYAYIDPLTELANRRFIEDTLTKEYSRNIRGEQSLAVMMVDIDHFKLFNDQYGHDVGDIVLKTVANELQRHIRSSDTIGRYGGEEFLIIVPNITKDDLLTLGKKLVSQIANAVIECGNVPHKATISIGAIWQGKGSVFSEKELVKYADNTLYTAKSKGRNCFCLYK
ncbi:GGDEF domain-containing protein [Colwelliaceae bacterium 6441]